MQRFSGGFFFTDRQSGWMGLEGSSPEVAVHPGSSRPCRTSPGTSERSGSRGWWWWLELGSARRAESQISGEKQSVVWFDYGMWIIRWEPARISLTGLQVAVSMTTCSSMTCPTPRPYLRSTFSIETRILSSPWPKSCIQGTISPTWAIILYGCSTTRASFSGCTRRTSTGWKDVCTFAFFGFCCSFVMLQNYYTDQRLYCHDTCVSVCSGGDSSRDVGGGSRDICYRHLHCLPEEIWGRTAPSEFWSNRHLSYSSYSLTRHMVNFILIPQSKTFYLLLLFHSLGAGFTHMFIGLVLLALNQISEAVPSNESNKLLCSVFGRSIAQ